MKIRWAVKERKSMKVSKQENKMNPERNKNVYVTKIETTSLNA